MKTIKKITVAELEQMLLTWNFGAQPATIQYQSEPKINKEGKLRFGNLMKLGAVNCIIDYDFAKAVNRELLKEGKEADFQAQQLWKGKGQHVNRRLIKHVDTDVKYLAYKYQRNLRSLHFDSALNFIPSVLLKPYFYKQSAPKNQGVDAGKEIKPRTLKLTNIRKIRMMKTEFQIVG